MSVVRGGGDLVLALVSASFGLPSLRVGWAIWRWRTQMTGGGWQMANADKGGGPLVSQRYTVSAPSSRRQTHVHASTCLPRDAQPLTSDAQPEDTRYGGVWMDHRPWITQENMQCGDSGRPVTCEPTPVVADDPVHGPVGRDRRRRESGEAAPSRYAHWRELAFKSGGPATARAMLRRYCAPSDHWALYTAR